MQVLIRFLQFFTLVAVLASALLVFSTSSSIAAQLASSESAPPSASHEATLGPEKDEQADLSDAVVAAIDGAGNSRGGEARVLPSELIQPDIGLAELEHRLVPLTKDELRELASEWLMIVRDVTQEVMAAEIAIDRTEGAVAGEVRTHLANLMHERSAQFKKFVAIVDAWEKKGGDGDLIAEYRAYHDTVVMDELRSSGLKTLYVEAMRWLTDPNGGIKLIIGLGVVLASLVGLLFVARFIRGMVGGWLGRLPNLSRLLQSFLSAIAYWLVLLIGLVIVLSMMGLDVTPIFALIGGASFILAFAFQDTLGNIASGLMIMINRPFDEGDTVDVDGVIGKVKSVTIMATTIVTPDNRLIVAPNRNVWGSLIKNMTANETRRVDLVFGISYDDSIVEALDILTRITRDHPAVLADPEPVIRVQELADSSVNFICRPWVKTQDYWAVYWDLTQQMKAAFDEAGISIPFPQMDMHIREVPAQLAKA